MESGLQLITITITTNGDPAWQSTLHYIWHCRSLSLWSLIQKWRALLSKREESAETEMNADENAGTVIETGLLSSPLATLCSIYREGRKRAEKFASHPAVFVFAQLYF